MNCNVCGAEIPAGAAACPVCGAPAPAAGPAPQPGYDAQGGYVDPANQQYGDPYAQNMAAVNQQKTANKGLIIGIAVGVAVVVAVLVMWMLGVFGGGGHDGTYKLNSASAFGFEINEDQLATYGMNPDDYTIEIKGSKATMHLGGNDASCKVKFSGDKVTFSGDGQEIEGTYKSGKITISYSGIDMVFAK